MVTTNFPDGLTNAPPGSAMQTLVVPDPSSLHTYFDDFNLFTAAQWVITTTGTGTTVVGNEDGGVLTLLNSAANGDNKFLQASNGAGSVVAETFKFDTGKSLWFKTRFKVSDATASAFVIGLQLTDTTPLAATDGVFFSKAAASTTVNLVTVSATASTTTTTIGTIADATYVELAFHYTGTGSLFPYLNGVRAAALTSTPNVPITQTLAVSFGIQNGAAAAKSMAVDYIYVAKAR